ncbi:MAG: hypothetical protein NUW00_00750 [Candidatus Kaiserbacteria bacterium]|nr:hypothetical protein [Candidatus Kaiserbacteria bacterium]
MKQSFESPNGNNVDESRRGFLGKAGALVGGAFMGGALAGIVSAPEKVDPEPVTTIEEPSAGDPWILQNIGPLLEQLTSSPEDLLAIIDARNEMVAETVEYNEKIKKADLVISQNPPTSAQYQTHVSKKIMWELELDERKKYIDAYDEIILKINTMPTRDGDPKQHREDSSPQAQPEMSLATYSNKKIM